MAYVVTNQSGAVYHYNSKDALHRLNGPALINPNGNCIWFRYGLIVNLDGPAWDRPNGYKCWHTGVGSTWPKL